MKKFLVAVLIFGGAAIFGHDSAVAQDSTPQGNASQSSTGSIDQDIDLPRKDICSEKKQIIAANVQLTDAEAQAFWLVYDQYTADLVKTNND